MKTKQLLLTFLAVLLPLVSWADVWQDPETKVNYEYTVGKSDASVKAGKSNAAGSPYVTGDITILSKFTVDGSEYNVTSIGYQAFFSCSGLTTVTIPNSVTIIESWAFYGCSGLTSVTIPNSVTSIGEWAFSRCSSLTSVTIPNSVTSIGEETFRDCNSLTSVTIPNSVTSIGDFAFYGCSSLTSIEIPNSVTSIGLAAFSNCSGLTSVTIPNSVTSIGYSAFKGCSGLTSVTIGNSVTSIGGEAFRGCSGLTSVEIPNSVTSIGESAFKNCTSLTTVIIPNSVTVLNRGTFYECSSLTTVIIPNSVTKIEDGKTNNSISNGVFEGCSSLTSVTIGNSVKSIGNYAFYSCSNLTTVQIPNSVTSIGSYAFSGCSNLTSVTIPNSVTSIGSSAFSGCSGLTSITIPDSVTSIGYGAFSGCSSLTSVTIPNSVTSIGEDAFSSCNNLSSIEIPNSVTSIGKRAFSCCSGLTSVVIPNSVTSIGSQAFFVCSGLTSVEIPNSVTSIGDDAFSCCSGLTSMIVETGNTVYDSRDNCNAIIKTKTNELITGCKNTAIPNSVTRIGGRAFEDCSGLTSITIPNSVTSIGECAFYGCSGLTSVTIGTNVTSIGEQAFRDCSSLTYVKIPNSVTSIGGYAFYKCSSLISVTIPNSVVSIEDGVFDRCSGLTSIEIPNSVTSIGYSAFYECIGLTSVTIPNSVTSIGVHSFNYCYGLSSITSLIKEPFDIDNYVFFSGAYNSATLYVPVGTIDAYKATNGWRNFKNIEEIELAFKVEETSLVRAPNQIHVKAIFTNIPYRHTSLDEYVSFESDSESLTLESFSQSDYTYDLFFSAPKKDGSYTLTIHNTLYDAKGNVLDQNDNSITGEEEDNYTETFNFDGDELYVVAQAPLTGGALGEGSYTDLVFNDQVERVPASFISLVSPSGRAVAIHSVEYIDSISPARHRVNYGALDEDGLYTFTLSKELTSKNGKAMLYPYQSSIETPAANLVPESIAPVNEDWVAGKKQQITYAVKNVGTKPTKGESVDVIYLSSTDTWNSEAIELYRDIVSVDVEAQGSYTQTVSVDVPNVVDGKYYLILKTNVTHSINELSFADNNLFADGPNISVEVLKDDNNHFTLGRGESRLFRVQTVSDKNVEIIDKYDVANMYLGYYQLPYTDETPNRGSITIVGADASVRYYLLVSNNGKSETQSQQCELSVREFELEIGDVGRSTIVKHATAWVPVEVNGCTEIPTFYLMDSKGNKAECKQVVTKTETSFYTQFETASLATGQYSLYVESGGMTGMKQNVITVTNEQPRSSIVSKLVLPGTSRIGSTITAYIDYQNTGNVDLPAPLFILSGTEGSTYELPTGGTFTSDAHIYGVNENGVFSTLIPGESNRISVNITIPNEHIYTADYKLKTITEGCDGIDEPFYLQWLDVEPSETPSCYTDEEWSAYCERLRNNVGETWSTFIQALGRVADLIYTYGSVDYDANTLYNILKYSDLNPNNLNATARREQRQEQKTLQDVESGTLFIWKNGWNQIVEAEYNENYNTKEPVFLEWRKTHEANLVNSSASHNFIISHGWRDDRNGDTKKIAEALATKYPDSNIFGVDWSRDAWSIKDPVALMANIPARKIPHVADNVVLALCTIFDSNLNNLFLPNLHLIGHSHGAHVLGMVAHKLKLKPKRLTALDASTTLAHLFVETNKYGTGWNRSDAQFIDYYKSSVMAGTSLFKGHNNFILIKDKGGFVFDAINIIKNDGKRHGYSIEWFANSIKDKDNMSIGYSLSPNYLKEQWGKGYNPDQYHGVINGSNNKIENFSIRDENHISSDEWNYTKPWYEKQSYQGILNDNIFQNAFASSIDYESKTLMYYGSNDYIQGGTTEYLKMDIKNNADNLSVPLDVRMSETNSHALQVLYVSKSNSNNPSIKKDRDAVSSISAPTDLYFLAQHGSYYDPEGRTTGFGHVFSFNFTSKLWTDLGGTDDMDYLDCDFWLVSGVDKSSNYKTSPTRSVTLWKGELYPTDNCKVVTLRVKNPNLSCEAGSDRSITLKKGETTTNVRVSGTVERDNGKSLSYSWEKGNSVFSTAKDGNIALGVGTHPLTFRVEAKGGSNARKRATSTQSEDMAEDYVTITVKPYSPGDDDDESTNTASSWDPNEKVGIKGAGGKACVKPGETMEYAIYFENDAEKAQLAAQTVTVIDTLDTAFDLSTFEFTGSVVANTQVDGPAGAIETCTYTDMRPSNDLILKTEMKLDIDSRVVTVKYSSLDTLTNEPTQDVFAGFLPPNDSTHVGEGHFSYRVKLKDDVADGYTVTNQAHIFFDYNDEIATNVTSHRIDITAPSSWVVDLPPTTDKDSTMISWTGIDQGAGIKHYDVYYAKNGGAFELWKVKTTEESAYIDGVPGDYYEFFSVATDSLGYIENIKTKAEADILFVNPVGIKSTPSASENEVDVYPRIVRDQVMISVANAHKYDMVTTDVYDMNGRNCLSGRAVVRSGKHQQTFDCQSLAAGVYLVNVKADNKRLATVKIIKK